MNAPTRDTRWAKLARRLRRPLLEAFQVTPESNADLLREMMEPHAADGPMYWLRLLLALAIATLGLVLGSTAVVIGAMLISPLMAPILELGMALAVGLPRLAMRSFARVLASVTVVAGCAAAITVALPFKEITAAIADRAAPTALDLLIAVCCALMGAVSTACSTRAMPAAASGTAIAIALVPPLCVVGIGLGAHRFDIAGGATLLFTANFSAIMLVAVLTFRAFGFASARRAARSESSTRIGAVWRIVLPAVLVGVVFVPLYSALGEVAWEVRTRKLVTEELDEIARSIVRSQVHVSRHQVDIEILLLGDPKRALEIERDLTRRIERASGVIPKVAVMAVPDTETMRRALERGRPPATPRLVPERAVDARVGESLVAAWPRSAGVLAAWRFDLDSGGRAHVDVVHLGADLGNAGRELLSRQIERSLGAPLSLTTHSLPQEPLSCGAAPERGCLERLTAVVVEAAKWDEINACVTRPEATDGGALEPEVSAAFAAALDTVPNGRATTRRGEAWSVAAQLLPCAVEPAEPSVAPSLDAAPSEASVDAASARDATTD